MIYSFRPEGCRLYPLVYNEYEGKVVRTRAKVCVDDIENIHVFFKKLS